MTDTVSLIRLRPIEKEFIDCRAMVLTLANLPPSEWPPIEFLHRRVKEIVNAK